MHSAVAHARCHSGQSNPAHLPTNCLRVPRRTQVKLAEYNNMKGQLSAVARKAGGSLAVRDISTLVKPSQVIDSENMTTVFVVVGKYAIKDWETSYEKMCSFVVSACSLLPHAWSAQLFTDKHEDVSLLLVTFPVDCTWRAALGAPLQQNDSGGQ